MSWRPVPALSETLAGRCPPWAERFLRGVGVAVHEWGMIGDGDGVLIGVSGGKDSLCLALALELRRRRVRDKYRLSALMVEWEERRLSPEAKDALGAYFDLLGLPFETRTARLSGEASGEKFGCYACARARKRILFEAAREKGMGIVAFGHHLDDLAQTILMNLALHGRFEGMRPVRSFFSGEVKVIRPLCRTREGRIRTFAERMGLPVAEGECPYASSNPRNKMRSIIAEMTKIDRLVRENIYSAQVREERGFIGSEEQGL